MLQGFRSLSSRLGLSGSSPRKSTEEAVEALNGEPGGSSKPPTADVHPRDQSVDERPEPPSNNVRSPNSLGSRKRKDPPSEEIRSKGLRRPSRAASEASLVLTSASPQTPTSRPAEQKRRIDIYDHPEAGEEVNKEKLSTQPPKRQRGLQGRAKNGTLFKRNPLGNGSVSVPAPSPAQGTRSHEKARREAAARSKEIRAESDTPLKSPIRVVIRGEKGGSARKKTVDVQESQTPGELENDQSPDVANDTANQPVVTDEAQKHHQPPVATPEVAVDGENGEVLASEEVPEEGQNDGPSQPPEKEAAKKKKSALKKTKEDHTPAAVEGIEEAIMLYNCRGDWLKVLVSARMCAASATKTKSRRISDAIALSKQLSKAYRAIYRDDINETEVTELEADIENTTEQLAQLAETIAHATPELYDVHFIEQVYEHVIPSMSWMLRRVLIVRFDKEKKNMPIKSLQEIMSLIEIIMIFRNFAKGAKSRPKEITSESGHAVLSLTRGAVAGLISIYKKYLSVLQTHEDSMARMIEGQRRQQEIARQHAEAVAAAEARRRERSESYQQKVQASKEREARAAAAQKARQEAYNARWQESLMAGTSLAEQRLRQKLGLPAYPSSRALPLRESAIDLDDMDLDSSDDSDLDFDNDFESIDRQRHPPQQPKSMQPTRPRPRREPTEEIPAPAVEAAAWSEAQTEALLWGLQTFRGGRDDSGGGGGGGQDRYSDILHAPDVRDLLRDKTEFELAEHALFLKNTMARTMKLEETLFPGKWAFLESV